MQCLKSHDVPSICQRCQIVSRTFSGSLQNYHTLVTDCEKKQKIKIKIKKTPWCKTADNLLKEDLFFPDGVFSLLLCFLEINFTVRYGCCVISVHRLCPQGDDCSISCPAGLYGTNCTSSCSCRNEISCSHIDGFCICKEGSDLLFFACHPLLCVLFVSKLIHSCMLKCCNCRCREEYHCGS